MDIIQNERKFKQIEENINLILKIGYNVRCMYFYCCNDDNQIVGECLLKFGEDNVCVVIVYYDKKLKQQKQTFDINSYMIETYKFLKSKGVYIVDRVPSVHFLSEANAGKRYLDENGLWENDIESRSNKFKEFLKKARGRKVFYCIYGDKSVLMYCYKNPLKLKMERGLFDKIFNSNKIVTFGEFILWN